MLVLLQVSAEAIDALAEHGHLDFRGTGVGAMGLVSVDQLLLFSGIERQCVRCRTLTVQTTTLPGEGPAPLAGLATEPLQTLLQPSFQIIRFRSLIVVLIMHSTQGSTNFQILVTQ